MPVYQNTKKHSQSALSKPMGRLISLLYFVQFNGYYAVLALVISFGGMGSSRMVTIPMRAVVLLGALYIVKWFKMPKLGDKRRKPIEMLLWFWGVYGCRLIFDFIFMGDTGGMSRYELPLFGFGICLLPMLAGMTLVRSQKAISYAYWGYLLGSLCFCVVTVVLYRELLTEGVSRAMGGKEDGTVSSINLGYCSAATILLVYAYFMSHKNKLKWILLGLGSVAMPIMLLSGNRGSIVALFCGMSGFTLSLFKGKHKGKALLGVLVGVGLLLGYVMWSNSYGGGGLQRLTSTFSALSEGTEDEGEMGRISLWKAAFDGFLHSPIWGEASMVYWEGVGGRTWAHNIILDVLHSTGLIGFCLFIPPLCTAVKKALWHMARMTEYSWICACFIVGCVSAMFSFGAFFHAGFWVFFGMVLMLPNQEVRKK